MAATSDLAEQVTQLGEEETNSAGDTGETTHEPALASDADESPVNPLHMVTAEASFSEATSIDLPVGATRSSVARILVKPGQIFRVQVDNEVKEVHGTCPSSEEEEEEHVTFLYSTHDLYVSSGLFIMLDCECTGKTNDIDDVKTIDVRAVRRVSR